LILSLVLRADVVGVSKGEAKMAMEVFPIGRKTL